MAFKATAASIAIRKIGINRVLKKQVRNVYFLEGSPDTTFGITYSQVAI